MGMQDPFSDEAVEARRRLRTIRQNLGPFAAGLLNDNPESFAEFAEETADQLGQAAGFQGASIADPETFASFIGRTAQQHEQATGQPSPLRGTEGRRVQRREGEGLPFDREAAAFATEALLFGPGRALAGNLAFEGFSNAVSHSPLPTPVNTALEGLLAAAALKKGKIGPARAAISSGIGGAVGLGADALGVGQQVERLGAGVIGTGISDVPFQKLGPLIRGGRAVGQDVPAASFIGRGQARESSAPIQAIRDAPGAVADAIRPRATAFAATDDALRAAGEAVQVPGTQAPLPSRVFHGTGEVFEKFDPGRQNPDALYGPGAYFTEAPEVASGYARTRGGTAPNVQPIQLRMNKVLDIDAPLDADMQRIRADMIAEADRTQEGFNLVADGVERTNLPIEDIQTNGQMHRFLTGAFGNKSDVNDFLSANGYDGITHIGGQRTGTPAHRVWVAIGDQDGNLEGQISTAIGRTPPAAATDEGLGGVQAELRASQDAQLRLRQAQRQDPLDLDAAQAQALETDIGLRTALDNAVTEGRITADQSADIFGRRLETQTGREVGEGLEAAGRQVDEAIESTELPSGPTRVPTGSAIFETRTPNPQEFRGGTIERLAENTLGRGPQPIKRAGQRIGETFEQIPEVRVGTNERARVIRNADSRGNQVMVRTRRDLNEVFDFDENHAIPSLRGIDPELPGAPTVSDVAARLPRFVERLSEQQQAALERLRIELVPMKQALDEAGIEISERADVIEGGFYIPRGNASKEGLDLPSGTGGGRRGKAGFERAARFDSQAQGIADNLTYVTPWEAAGGLVRQAGRRVGDENLATFFKTLKDEQGKLLGETARDRLLRQFPEITQRMGEAQTTVARLKSGLTRLNRRQNDALERFVNDPNFAAEDAVDFNDLVDVLNSVRITRGNFRGANIADVEQLLIQAKTQVKALRPQYKNAIDSTRGAGIGRGAIPDIPALNGRAFPQAFADETNKILKEEGATGIPGLNAVNNLFRGLNATLDNSAPGIQGLLGLADDQRAYGRALSTNIKAWRNEDTLAKFVDDFDFRATETGRLNSTDWTNSGLRFGGEETEFQLGQGGLRRLSRAPGIRQANRAFGFFGDSLRLAWADDMLRDELASGKTLGQVRASGDLDRIANIANNMTGWSDGKAFKSYGDLLLFAPRFLQSRLTTLTKAAQGLRPGASIDQRNARRSMLKLIGGAVLLTTAANAAQGEETDYRPFRGADGKPSFTDPRGGKNPNFLRIRAFGRDWSLLGTWDSLAGAIINVGTGNPGQAVEAMGSFTTSIGANLLFNDEDFIGRQTKGDLGVISPQTAGFLLESMTPFATEEIPSAIGQAVGGDPLSGGATLVGEVFGAKSAPLSFRDRMDERARELGAENFDALGGFQQSAIIRDLEQTAEGRSFLFGTIDAEPDFIRVPRRERSGGISGFGFR